MADEEQDVNEEGTELSPMLVQVTAENFEELYTSEGKLVVSTVVSSKCKYCKEMIPFISQTAAKAEEYPNATFLLIDGDVAPEGARKLNVSMVPAFAFSLNGTVLETFTGNNTEKFMGLLKNTYHKRNEQMKEKDAADAAAAQAAAAAAAEAAPAEEE